MNDQQPMQHGSLLSYFLGFTLSIVLTLVAYQLVAGRLLSGWELILSLMLCAAAQLVVQLVFFLHLGRATPRWNVMALAFMVLVVLIMVGGSLWIMKNLNYNMMPTHPTQELIDLDKQKGF